jgi:hypothetical protein
LVVVFVIFFINFVCIKKKKKKKKKKSWQSNHSKWKKKTNKKQKNTKPKARPRPRPSPFTTVPVNRHVWADHLLDNRADVPFAGDPLAEVPPRCTKVQRRNEPGSAARAAAARAAAAARTIGVTLGHGACFLFSFLLFFFFRCVSVMQERWVGGRKSDFVLEKRGKKKKKKKTTSMDKKKISQQKPQNRARTAGEDA